MREFKLYGTSKNLYAKNHFHRNQILPWDELLTQAELRNKFFYLLSSSDEIVDHISSGVYNLKNSTIMFYTKDYAVDVEFTENDIVSITCFYGEWVDDGI